MANTCNPLQETRCNEMRTENILSKFTKNHAKINWQNYFSCTGIVGIYPMKRILPHVLTFSAIICHFWVLSYCLSTNTPICWQHCLQWWCGVFSLYFTVPVICYMVLIKCRLNFCEIFAISYIVLYINVFFHEMQQMRCVSSQNLPFI